MSSLLKSTLNTCVLPIGGMIYIRSDVPLCLTEEEIKWLLDNDITTLVDLRSDQELECKPCQLKDVTGFTYYHLPVAGGGDTPKSREHLHQVYLGMVDEQMDTIIETILNDIYLYSKIKYSSRKTDIPKGLKRRVWIAKKQRII